MTSFLAEAELRNSSHSISCETAELQVIDCSVCESRTAELQDVVYFLCGSETAELQVTEYYLCGGGTAGLKVKALVWKWNCEASNRTKFSVWQRNCVTAKPQYSPCAEAELHHFRAPSHTLFYMRKRNCGNLSLSIFLVRRWNFKPKNIPCVEADLQNFKLHNSLCAEAELRHIIVCMWNLSGFLCKNPKCPGAQGWRPLCQSHLGGAGLNSAILAVAPTGIVLVCSVLIKYDRISWRVTRIRI